MSESIVNKTGISFSTTGNAAYQWAFVGFWVSFGLVSGAGTVVLLGSVLLKIAKAITS